MEKLQVASQSGTLIGGKIPGTGSPDSENVKRSSHTVQGAKGNWRGYAGSLIQPFGVASTEMESFLGKRKAWDKPTTKTSVY